MQHTAFSILIIYSSLLQCAYSQNDNEIYKWGNWKKWGDLGNGTYKNPIVPADFSDVDCIRVGSDFYAVSSTGSRK